MPDERFTFKSKPLPLINAGYPQVEISIFSNIFLLMTLSETLLTYQRTLCQDLGRICGKLSVPLYQTVSLSVIQIMYDMTNEV